MTKQRLPWTVTQNSIMAHLYRETPYGQLKSQCGKFTINPEDIINDDDLLRKAKKCGTCKLFYYVNRGSMSDLSRDEEYMRAHRASLGRDKPVLCAEDFR